MDPVEVAPAARIASLVSIADAVTEFAVPQAEINVALREAAVIYHGNCGRSSAGIPANKPQLQQELFAALQLVRRGNLLVSAYPEFATRLTSLTTAHATAWTSGLNPWFVLSAAEVRHGLRWILGCPLRQSAYTCGCCGVLADAAGCHAVMCTRSGCAARGHTVVKEVMFSLFQEAGWRAEKECATRGHPDLRPADVLVHNYNNGRAAAIDFTVYARGVSETVDSLDQAVQAKMVKYDAVCGQEGWKFVPFAADTFGALHPGARQVVSRVIDALVKRKEAKFPLALFPCGTLVWRAIGSAVIARATGQHARHAEADSPCGLDLAMLSLPAPRLGRAKTRTRSSGSPTAGDGRDGSEARAGDTTMTATAGPCSS